MADPRGFLDVPKARLPKRPVWERVQDWREVERPLPDAELRAQARRCMDCGVPFCHQGCPLGNQIPDWNDLVRRGRWADASARLHATNNFPEVTGRICPAPCEASCVLNIEQAPVSIRAIEKQTADRAWDEGWLPPAAPAPPTGKRIAVVGSGPAGLAAAQQLARAGHDVTVYERDDRLGGLLRYGIPDFKLEKGLLDRRLEQLRAEGVRFRTGVEAGVDLPASRLVAEHDAVLLALGALAPRDMPIPGRELQGVHLAMDYLVQQNRVVAGDDVSDPVSAAGKRVVILGGGDTGADCLGTAHRQGASEVHHYHYKPAPPEGHNPETPWPLWPMALQPSSAHEEGGERGWSVVTKEFLGDSRGRLRALRCVRVEWPEGDDGRRQMRELEGSTFELPCELALIAIGFSGTEEAPLLRDLGLTRTARGTVPVDEGFQTPIPGVFSCGDATRGASLVVWAIYEGREAARAIDERVMGRARLPTVPAPRPFA